MGKNSGFSTVWSVIVSSVRLDLSPLCNAHFRLYLCAACSLQPAVSTFCPGRLTTSHCTSIIVALAHNRQKPEKNPFTHHIAEDVTWLFLEHLIKKLFDSFWNFILVKISHSFAFFLQTVSTIFYRHLESPRQLKSFTAASLWCTWSIIPVPSQFSVAFQWKGGRLLQGLSKYILICDLLCVALWLLLSFAYLCGLCLFIAIKKMRNNLVLLQESF